MSIKINKISGFWLFCIVTKVTFNINGPLPEYMDAADMIYKDLTEDEKELWKKKAEELRGREEGMEYLKLEKRYKRMRSANCSATQIANCRALRKQAIDTIVAHVVNTGF